MRGDFVARPAGLGRVGVLDDVLQCAQFLLQPVDQLLLTKDGTIQLVDRVFGKRKLRFDFREAVFQRFRIGQIVSLVSCDRSPAHVNA